MPELGEVGHLLFGPLGRRHPHASASGQLTRVRHHTELLQLLNDLTPTALAADQRVQDTLHQVTLWGHGRGGGQVKSGTEQGRSKVRVMADTQWGHREGHGKNGELYDTPRS